MRVEAELIRISPTHRVKTLSNLSGIRQEMVSVYRQGRKGTLKTEDMTRFIYALREIGRVIELTSFETQLAQMSDHELLKIITDKIARMEGRQNGGPAIRPEALNGKAPTI